MKKKGFTLIELLAVIVILAVLALIITPVITGIISQSKESADLRSAEAYIKAAENFYTSTLLNVENGSLLGTNVIDKLDVSNQAASGEVIVDEDGNVEIAIVIGRKCYRKAKTADVNQIIVDDGVEECSTYTPERCFTYTLDSNNEATITDYLCGGTGGLSNGLYVSNNDGEFSNVNIPSTIGGYNVVTIGTNAFKEKYIDSVIIPEGVTTIEESAFYTCGLSKVSLPSTLTLIGIKAFMLDNLTSVIIPDGVKKISTSAFQDNSISVLTLGSGLQYTEGNSFSGNNLISVNIPSNLVLIGWGAFSYNNLTSVTIQEGVQNIGPRSFYYNNLTSITVPNSVTLIGEDAFRSNSSLSSITIDNSEGIISGSPWGSSAEITYLR